MFFIPACLVASTCFLQMVNKTGVRKEGWQASLLPSIDFVLFLHFTLSASTSLSLSLSLPLSLSLHSHSLWMVEPRREQDKEKLNTEEEEEDGSERRS